MDKIKEAIKQLEKLKEHCKSMQDIDECADYTSYISAVDIAIQALEEKIEREKCGVN